MDAKAMFFGAEQFVHIIALPVDQRQVEPAHAVNQHIETSTQVTCHDVHHADLAAVGIEQDQLPDTGARHRLADLGPETDHGFARERERAGKALMLGAEAHSLRRQKQHRHISRQVFERGVDHTVHQYRVHADG
jgi:hypothetical protein